MRYLYGLGHRRIAYVSGAPDTAITEQRRNGFLQATSECGIDTSFLYEAQDQFPRAAAIAQDIMALRP